MAIPLTQRLLHPDFEAKLQDISNQSVVARSLLLSDKQPINDEFVRNAQLTASGDVVFTPVGKTALVEIDATGEEVYLNKGRQSCKPGKFARTYAKQFGLDFYDTDVEAFNNLILAENKGFEDYNFRLVSGDEITKYYHVSKYAIGESLGTLERSCMRDTHKLPFMKMYRDNPQRISMLCLFSKKSVDKIIGRALVWKTNMGTYMDRIYADDVNQKVFIRYARKQGWLYGEQQTYQDKNIMRDNTVVCTNRDLYVTDLVIDFNQKFPYIDTFKHLYPSFGIASGQAHLGSGHHYGGVYQGQQGEASARSSCVRSRFHHGALIHGAAEGYASYAARSKSERDWFFPGELMQDALDRAMYYMGNMTTGIDGRMYVIDNPNIVFLSGETCRLPAPKSLAVQCFYDKKWYYKQSHIFINFTLLDGEGNSLEITMRDLVVDDFFNKYELPRNAVGSKIVKVPGNLHKYMQRIEGGSNNEADLKS